MFSKTVASSVARRKGLDMVRAEGIFITIEGEVVLVTLADIAGMVEDSGGRIRDGVGAGGVGRMLGRVHVSTAMHSNKA